MVEHVFGHLLREELSVLREFNQFARLDRGPVGNAEMAAIRWRTAKRSTFGNVELHRQRASLQLSKHGRTPWLPGLLTRPDGHSRNLSSFAPRFKSAMVVHADNLHHRPQEW